jgi:hypothetical protein
MATEAGLINAVEKTDLRVKTASTKVTENEFAELEVFASQRGQTLSEWIRIPLSPPLLLLSCTCKMMIPMLIPL